MTNKELIDLLNKSKRLEQDQWVQLFCTFDEEDFQYARQIAAQLTRQNFGNQVFFRGLIEFSNICQNDCYYCGIRKSNSRPVRYRLSEEEILHCCREGYELGFRTFVLQSGEGGWSASDAFLHLIQSMRQEFSDCAITVAVGECSREFYEKLFAAGANRYLLRHETADSVHYSRLHPPEMRLENRLNCLKTLREIGFQCGCGMMIGSPYQSAETLAKDMELITEFQPEMVGIGPFLSQKDTPFKDFPSGEVSLTLFAICLIRILSPQVLMPATTALETRGRSGRIEGILCGCNVVMPNLSPENVKKNYMLYDNKAGIHQSGAQSLESLRREMESIGRRVVVGRGDHIRFSRPGKKDAR